MPGVGIIPTDQVLPPIIKRNYGKWVSHEFLNTGVYRHVSENGESCYSIRVGMPTNARVSTSTLYKICDLADKYTGGHFRVTTRNHVEFIGVEKDRIDELIQDIEKMGLPVGGTGRRFHQTTCCTGWLHCQIAATDAPAIAKAISDVLYDGFVSKEEPYPAKLKISVSGCINQCGDGSTANIGVVGIYREVPVVDENKVKLCERPTVVRICPTAAIRAKGKDGIEIVSERCIYCGYCQVACEAIAMRSETAGVAVVVGGKAGNTGAGPSWAKLVIPFLSNNAPSWPEVTGAVKKIVAAWAKDAHRDERMGDWIARIGWEKFFDKTGIPVSDKHVDGLAGGIRNLRSNLRFHW